jgi:hypothetical protein
MKLTQKNQIILGFIILLIVIAGILMYFYYPTKRSENFDNISSDITKLQQDLIILLNNTTGQDVSQLVLENFRYNTSKVIDCLSAKFSKLGISEDDLVISADTLDKPIISIYQNNPKIYNILEKCKFLEILGTTLATVSWATNAPNKNANKLKNFFNCLQSINWGDINVWMSFTDPEGDIFYCINA